jgi:hypothetical protein
MGSKLIQELSILFVLPVLYGHFCALLDAQELLRYDYWFTLIYCPAEKLSGVLLFASYLFSNAVTFRLELLIRAICLAGFSAPVCFMKNIMHHLNDHYSAVATKLT